MFARYLATSTRSLLATSTRSTAQSIENAGASASRNFSATSAARTTTIYVGNLSWNTDEGILEENFKRFGLIEKANIVMRDGRSAGFAFIDFSDEQAAKSAIEGMHNTELDGRTLNVQERNQRSDSGDSRGRGGFSRGGGRGGFGRGRGGGGGYGRGGGGGYGRDNGGGSYGRDNGYSGGRDGSF